MYFPEEKWHEGGIIPEEYWEVESEEEERKERGEEG